jgi:hypothetical protein
MLGGEDVRLDDGAQTAAVAALPVGGKFLCLFSVNGVRSTWNGTVTERGNARITVKYAEAPGRKFYLPADQGVIVHEIFPAPIAVAPPMAAQGPGAEDIMARLMDEAVQEAGDEEVPKKQDTSKKATPDSPEIALDPEHWGELGSFADIERAMTVISSMSAKLHGDNKYIANDIVKAIKEMMHLASEAPVICRAPRFQSAGITLIKRLLMMKRAAEGQSLAQVVAFGEQVEARKNPSWLIEADKKTNEFLKSLGVAPQYGPPQSKNQPKETKSAPKSKN